MIRFIFLRWVIENLLCHLLKPYVIFQDGSQMASHSRGKSFNRSLLVILQIELTIEGLELYLVRFEQFQQPTSFLSTLR